MAKFLTTYNTSSEIDNIIRNAKDWLILISPFFKVSNIFIERLHDAGSRNVQIYLIYGKEELQPHEFQVLSKIENTSLWFYENVHAKCYCNQDSVVISSMNLYEFSEKNNREMGVLLKKETEPEAYNEACAEIQSILRSSVRKTFIQQQAINPISGIPANPESKVEVQKTAKSIISESIINAVNKLYKTNEKGFCIRCGTGMRLDTDHPLCDDCYASWAKFKNADYPEEYCHSCGKHRKTTKEKPLCSTCFYKR